MTRRPAVLILVATLVGAACSNLPVTRFEPPERFIPFVADSTDNVGLGSDIAVTADGVPFLTYFGFPAKPDPGEIVVARPVGAPFIPAVQVTSLADDGAWTQGAVAQSKEFPNVPVPFDPALVESLRGLDPRNSNGTSVAIGEDGTPRVAWASNNGIWYGEIATGSTVQQVWKLGGSLSVAGPIGRPGIAVDGNVPMVAWTSIVAGKQEVRLATPKGDGWTQEVVARLGCRGCRAPRPTSIAVTPDGPLVVFVDEGAGEVVVARPSRGAWSFEVVAQGLSHVAGVSLDVTERVARISYDTGDGTVELAVDEGTTWRTEEVGPTGDIREGAGNFAPTTGLAVGSDGSVYVAWSDAHDVVHLARQTDAGFEDLPTFGTDGGAYPSLAAGTQGRIYLTWYDLSTEDLLMGLLGRFSDLLVAQPSPTPDVTVRPGQGETCDPDGTDLSIGALADTWDGVTCLAVDAGVSFTVTVQNTSAAIHDFSIYPSPDETTPEAAFFESSRDPVPASGEKRYAIDPIEDPGDYFFRCDFHPTTMTGAFIVAG